MSDSFANVSLEPAAAELEIPMPIEGIGSETFWLNEVEQAIKRRKPYIDKARKNLERYHGAKAALVGYGSDDVINVNVDFYNTEQKKAQLFYQNPKMVLTPKRTDAQGQPMDEQAVTASAVLNYYLGADKIDATAMVDQMLSDLLVASGAAFSKIGYQSIVTDVPVPTGRLDPMTGQPALGPDGQPETTTVPKVIWDDYYWEEISPEFALIPASFTTTRYDKAPWLGWEFNLDADRISREFGIDRSLVLDGSRDSESLVPEDDKPYVKSTTRGKEIWYRAAVYDPEAKSPEEYRRMVILEKDGKERVVVHGKSPYQRFDEATGQFLAGMKGNPIHVATLRTMTGTAIPNSDCQMSRQLVDEKSMGRTQMVEQRRRNVPLRGINKMAPGISGKTVEQLERAVTQGIILFEGPISPQDFAVLANATFPRENFTFNDITTQDIEKTWALSANQNSVLADSQRTATEINSVDKASETRMSKERDRFLMWFTKGTQKLFSLIQLFADEPQIVKIVGPQGDAQWKSWDKTTIAGEYAFDMHPDSSNRIDAAEQLNKTLRGFNLLANEPTINRAMLTKQIVQQLGWDPAMVMQQPAQPPPEKPKISLSFSGADLSNPVVLRFLKENGAPVTDLDIQAASAAHTGVMPSPDSLSPAPTPPVGGPPGAVADVPHGGRAVQATTIDQHEQGR